jgi:glycine/D-amino acid oxidase-like deaminating enzyme/nitrite reductase/ring-hydroxylating ferredoxin subunit
MKPASAQSGSLWMATASVPQQPALRADVAASVCVIGAGIAGMTTAYLLAREGKSVIVVDDGPIAGGQTRRTTAHLSNAIDARYFEIERLHGEQGARLAADSHTAAIDRIEAIVRDEKIGCDFVRLDGFLFVPPNKPQDVLDRELEAAHRAGLEDVEGLTRAPLKCFDTGPCLRFPRQGQFHPLKYLAGLARALQLGRGRIFSGTHVESIETGSAARVKTRNGPVITADAVVVATNTPINDRIAIHTKQAPYITYAIGASVPHGSLPTMLLWDTEQEDNPDAYHYVRLAPGAAPGSDTLIVGGKDHKTGQADDTGERHARLESWARQRFPMIREIAFRWSGQVMESVDGLAFIGRNPLDHPDVFIATGDSGMGMTHGTIAGMLLTELILGRENPWATLYDPSRKTLRAAGEFARENLNVAKQYGDWLTGGDVSSPDEIARGKGAVLRRGLTKVAVYGDEQGVFHEQSAVCPHLGCIVAWNDAEKTWDCPCHGSRFGSTGRVINGPANRGLARLEEKT